MYITNSILVSDDVFTLWFVFFFFQSLSSKYFQVGRNLPTPSHPSPRHTVTDMPHPPQPKAAPHPHTLTHQPPQAAPSHPHTLTHQPPQAAPSHPHTLTHQPPQPKAAPMKTLQKRTTEENLNLVNFENLTNFKRDVFDNKPKLPGLKPVDHRPKWQHTHQDGDGVRGEAVRGEGVKAVMKAPSKETIGIDSILSETNFLKKQRSVCTVYFMHTRDYAFTCT